MEPSAGRFVLVVDDVPPIARSIARLLTERRGFDATGFTSSLDALAYCEARRPWLVLLDVRMPELDGLTLARHLRARDPQLPIVFVTGTPGDLDIVGLGPPLRVVSKPFTSTAILDAVDALSS